MKYTSIISSFAIAFGSSALLLVAAAYYGNVLGKEQFGLFSWILAIVGLTAPFTRLGLPTLALREVSSAQSAGDQKASSRLLSDSLVLTLLLSGVAALAFCVVGAWIPELAALSKQTIFVVAILIIVSPMIETILSFFVASGRHALGQFLTSLLRIILYLAFFFALVQFSGDTALLAPDALITHALSAVAVLAASLIGLCRLGIVSFPKEKSGYGALYTRLKLLIARSKSLTGTAFLGILEAQGFLAFSVIVLSVGDIGLLRIAIAISGASALVFGILYRVYNKEMRLSIETGNAGESAAISGTISLIATAFSGALVVAFYFFGEQALKVIFGAEFGDAYLATLILLAGQFAVCCIGPVVAANYLGGRDRVGVKSTAWSIAFAMPCMFVFGHLFGLTGVASALALGLILKCVLLLVDVKRVLGFDPTLVAGLGYMMKSSTPR